MASLAVKSTFQFSVLMKKTRCKNDIRIYNKE